jgi:hypothetical protein
LKDEDLEYEWRITEIQLRKTYVLSFCALCFIGDLLWTFLLSEVSLTGKLIKLAIDLVNFVCLLMIYYHPNVKAIQEVMEITASGEDYHYTKWDMIKFKLAI